MNYICDWLLHNDTCQEDSNPSKDNRNRSSSVIWHNRCCFFFPYYALFQLSSGIVHVRLRKDKLCAISKKCIFLKSVSPKITNLIGEFNIREHHYRKNFVRDDSITVKENYVSIAFVISQSKTSRMYSAKYRQRHFIFFTKILHQSLKLFYSAVLVVRRNNKWSQYTNHPNVLT